MEYFFACLAKISKKMQVGKDCIFMFDFDGTLSKIAKTPEDAFLENSTRNLLKKISENFSVAIISGRTISSIKSKIKLPNLIYAGCHGFKWEMGGKKDDIKIPQTIREALKKNKRIFKLLIKNYSGLSIEEKGFGFAIHCRNLSRQKSLIFLQELKRNNYFLDNSGLISIIKGKKVLEFSPNINWNKGMFAEFLLKRLDGNFLPVYVGDDTTDESAFCALQKGITIRMGKKRQSYAKYFIKTNEIDKLLLWLISTA